MNGAACSPGADSCSPLAPVRLHRVAPMRFPLGWRRGRHRHQGMHELVLVLDGRLRTEIDGEERIAEAGTAVLHPAGVDHVDTTLGSRPLEILMADFAAPM